MSFDNRSGLLVAAIASGVVGTLIVVAMFVVGRHTMTETGASPPAATPEYGRQLLRETAALLGPDHDDPDMRFSGSRLACASCHLATGAKPGTLSLFQAADRYPRFSGRDGGMGDLRDRINGCMQRSMNGRPLPRDSVEMIAMESYILSLADRFKASAESRREAVEPPSFVEPDRAASVNAGQAVFEQRCQICHGSDGAGLMATTDPSAGYVFPPLWGPDSFNDGAGMHRVLTAARFIKARMPFGQPDLTDDEAYDVAAYINSQPRPAMQGLDVDYPDRALKPVDSPYPPYADPFPREQHRFGPFGPIRAYYDNLDEAP
jgi:thiosulfate dehydrogenase